MPLTFAHPAVILPFSRKSRYINFSAMVLGSMAPDFEYFLRGQPAGDIGHTFTGFFYYNLPLVAFIYFIYHFFVHQTLFNHLPVFLQDTYINKIESGFAFKVVVFIYSALIGMATHIAWDSFTHKNGYMVLKFPKIFTYTYNIYGFNIPLYKFLQHGSTLFGIGLILLYMFFRALPRSQKNPKVYIKHKLIFWSSLILLTILIVSLWYVVDYISVLSYGVVVVRIIDSFLISLFLISIFFKYVHVKNNI
ncbi:DUF4184 family protein [Heyndrickxia oleronia]|uniref:DUF4184 family protein n=1 Tax=Heyndrickxia oleronia TaxID=38875 RepID=UPI00203B87EC|nr:DUF4184 family protein [Heyndrickxia oleronia]MCM3239476.1 DUF4184 family protein [Heyndrickxia oleronia]